MDVGFIQPLVDELLAHLAIVANHIGHQALEIKNLHAVVAKLLREDIVLLLRHFQIRNIIEQQTLKRIRGKVEQLAPRAVQNHLAQFANLAFDLYSGHRFALLHWGC